MSPIFGIPANVVYATAGIYAVLVLASLIVWVMRRRNPGERYSELAARTEFLVVDDRRLHARILFNRPSPSSFSPSSPISR